MQMKIVLDMREIGISSAELLEAADDTSVMTVIRTSSKRTLPLSFEALNVTRYNFTLEH